MADAFTPFNFTMEKDPVSTWNRNIDQVGPIEQPNGTSTTVNGADIRYCPHLELAANSTRRCSVANHRLGSAEFEKYESSWSDPVRGAVISCMKDGYSPLVLRWSVLDAMVTPWGVAL
ncbi:MAG: hypothetical protein K0V04_30035 [Deltaproteobacteria bacterium]|nr:hypothetical protein [Deltaproteobacteria bacterium]